jgi:serine phosphatase RsbU (regulator of sigma subunit)
MTVANAGHLPPYLNGEEIGVPGSLPLGIVSPAQYELTTMRLVPGDRLTFVSDGVVEAQSQSRSKSRSSELFGFDRTREISREPAAQIAAAARAFGQLDDITVVTVGYSGAVAAPVGAQA